MEWFRNLVNKFVENNLGKLLSIPPSITGFLLVVIRSMQDGVITDEEMHTIVQSGLGVNVLLFIPVILYIYFNHKN